jgi:hypothetical protein
MLAPPKCAGKEEQDRHYGKEDDDNVVMMAKQECQSDNHDDGDEELRGIADKEVPPKETEGPHAAGN